MGAVGGYVGTPADCILDESVKVERFMYKLILERVEDVQLDGTGWHGAVS